MEGGLPSQFRTDCPGFGVGIAARTHGSVIPDAYEGSCSNHASATVDSIMRCFSPCTPWHLVVVGATRHRSSPEIRSRSGALTSVRCPFWSQIFLSAYQYCYALKRRNTGRHVGEGWTQT